MNSTGIAENVQSAQHAIVYKLNRFIAISGNQLEFTGKSSSLMNGTP
jgi:hypothetical protein